MAADLRQQFAQLPKHVLWHLVDLFERHVRSVDGDDLYVKWSDIEAVLAQTMGTEEVMPSDFSEMHLPRVDIDQHVSGASVTGGTVTERPCPPADLPRYSPVLIRYNGEPDVSMAPDEHGAWLKEDDVRQFLRSLGFTRVGETFSRSLSEKTDEELGLREPGGTPVSEWE
jgi:hypothetical protein